MDLEENLIFLTEFLNYFEIISFARSCFNEAKTIKSVLNILTNKGDIYLIDNGSTDNTLDYVKKFKINIIKNKFNFGYDTAIEQGMRMASKENIVI